MSTYQSELAKRIREQNELRSIYDRRERAAQASYDSALGAMSSGAGLDALDNSARAMYRNIQAEIEKNRREEEARLKHERENMNWLERTGHTIGDFLGRGAAGVMKFGENVVDYFGTMFGASEDWVKHDFTRELLTDKLDSATKGSYLNDGQFGRILQEAATGAGNMLPSVLLAPIPGVGGALSAGSFMVNAGGGATEQALMDGASRSKALLYGTLSGVTEGAIEKISGGIGGVGKGLIEDIGKRSARSAVAKGALGTAKKYAGRMAGEGLEEIASDLIDPLYRAIYSGKVDYTGVNAGSLINTFGTGALASGLMLGGQAAVNNATAANRVRTRLAELNEIRAGLDERYYKGKLSEAQYRQGLEDINWLADKAARTLTKVSPGRAEKTVMKLGKASNIVGKLDKTARNELRSASGQSLLSEYGIERGENGFTARNRAKDGYNYLAMTPSLAAHADKLKFKPTNAELTPEQAELVSEYGKIGRDHAAIVFTDEISAKDKEGGTVQANGAYSDGVIYISRSAAQPIREVMRHELTHALEGSNAYGEYALFVLNEIANSKQLQAEYGATSELVADIAGSYDGIANDMGDIASELVAKYSERMFSDPKAVNRLARANKGLARRVLGLLTDRLTALGKGSNSTGMRKFLLRAEALYRKALAAKSADAATSGSANSDAPESAKITENSPKIGGISGINSRYDSMKKEKIRNDKLSLRKYSLKESIKGLTTYNEIEMNRIKMNKNNQIAEDYQSIIEFLSDSLNGLNNKFLYIGKIDSEVAMKIRNEAGIDVNEYNYVLSSEDIRHIFKNHSDEKKESMRGQVAINDKNILDIIETMIRPDKVSKDINEKSGVTSIVFEKNVDGRLMAITILSTDKRRLTLKSARIIKRRIVSPSVQSADSGKTSTSKTLRSLDSSSNSISDKSKNVNSLEENSLKNGKKPNDDAAIKDELYRMLDSGKDMGATSLNGNVANDKENAQNINEKGVKFSLKNENYDSMNVCLTPEQADFFKDSEVRDKKGRLLVVYHGTPYGIFHKFKDSQVYFFSANKKFAEEYADEKAFDNELDSKASIVEAYLNSKKLFDINNKRDFDFLKDNLPDEIEYGFGGLVFGKNEFIELLKGNQTIIPRWSKEQIKNAAFGHSIGNGSRDGQSNDVFVGIDKNNNVVYVDRYSGKYLKYISGADVNKLLSGELVKANFYKNVFGNNEISVAEYNSLKAEDSNTVFYYIPKYEIISPQKTTQEKTHKKGQDNWTYVELSLFNNNGKPETLIDLLMRSGYDGIKVTEKGVDNYAVFHSNQIKLTTNKTPTSSSDIRFSIEKKKTPKKAYTHNDVNAMVNEVLKVIAKEGGVKLRDDAAIKDELYRMLDSGKDMGAAAIIVSERIADAAYLERFDPERVENAHDVIEFYKKYINKRYNLDAIDEELKAYFGDKYGAVKRAAGNKQGADIAGVKEIVPALKELGIELAESDNAAEVFIKAYLKYLDAREDVKGYKQAVLDMKNADGRKALVQSLARGLLFAFDKYGSDTKMYKQVKELKEANEKLKRYNRETVRAAEARASIVEQARLFKEMARRGIASSVIQDDITDGLIKTMARIVSRKDINVANLSAATVIFAKFYTEERVGIDFDPHLRLNIESLAAELEGADKRSKNLTLWQLQLADNILKGVRHYIRTTDNITRQGRSMSARKVAADGIEKLRESERLREKYRIKGFVIGLLRKMHAIVDPKCVAVIADGGRKDGALAELLADLKAAETERNAMQIDFMTPMDEFFKDNKHYDKRLAEAITIGGVDMKFDDAISILLTSKRIHAAATLEGVEYNGVRYKGGGFSYELEDGKTVYIDVTRADIEQIEQALTNADREYIEIIEEFFNVHSRDAKKATDYRLLGYTNVYDGEYYYPLRRAEELIAKKFSDARDLMTDVQNVYNFSFNKHTVENARNPIKLRGSLAVFTEHTQLISVYATMTEALRNFDKVMSVNVNAGNPSARAETLRSVLKENTPFIDKYLNDLMQDLQGAGRQKTNKILATIRDGYIKAVLGANIKTFISQWAGVPAAFMYLSPKHVVKGYAMRVPEAEFVEHSKFGKAHIYNKSAIRAEGIEQKIGWLGDKMTAPISFMDKKMHIGLWNACRVQIAAENGAGYELGTDANYRLADTLYEKVARETQSTNVISERSAMQRSSSEILRAATNFSSDAVKQLSRITEAAVVHIYNELRYKEGAITLQELRESRRQLVRAALAFALSNAIYVAIGLLFNAMLKKRDDEGKKWRINDYLTAFGTGMLESYAGLFPVFRDVFNKIVSGYDIDHFSYSMINDLIDSTMSAYKLAEKGFKGEEVTRSEALKTMRDTFYAAAAFIGVPGRNIEKYAKMVVGFFDEGAVYKLNSLIYAPKKSELNVAIEEKNASLTESIFEALLLERGLGDLSAGDARKLLELYKAGFDIIPSACPDKLTWKDSNGEKQEKELKAADKAVYRANRNKALKDIAKLLHSGDYESLADKERAAAVNRIIEYYNALARAKVIGADEITMQSIIASLLSVKDMAVLFAEHASLESDIGKNGNVVTGSKKRKLIALLNSYNLTYAEKEALLVLFGYAPTNKSSFKTNLNRTRLSADEQAKVLGLVNKST